MTRSCRGPTNIRGHRTKFSHYVDLVVMYEYSVVVAAYDMMQPICFLIQLHGSVCKGSFQSFSTHCVCNAVNYEKELLQCVGTAMVRTAAELYPADFALRICPGSVLGTLLQAYSKTCMKRNHCEREKYLYKYITCPKNVQKI